MTNPDKLRALPPDRRELTVQKLPLDPAANRSEVSPAYHGARVQNGNAGPASEYGRMIRRHKGAFIFMTLLGGLAGVLITLPQTKIYQARTSLEFQDLNQNFMDSKQANPVSDSGSYNAMNDLQTQIKILQSAVLLKAVEQKMKLKGAFPTHPNVDRFALWRKALNLPEPEAVTAQEQELAAMRNSLKVRASGQTRIVEVMVDSADPKLAAQFANLLTNEFIEENVEARWNMTQRTGEFLSRQLDEMRVKLERSEDGLQAYAQRSGLMFTSDKTSPSEERLRQLQQSLSVAQADRIAKQSRYEMARQSPPESLPDILNDSSLRSYQEKITEFRRQSAELTETYAPGNSRIKKVDAQMAELQLAFQHERDLILKRIQNDYEEATRREKLLAADYDGQTRLLSSENERSIQYNILKREVESNRQIYDAMLTKVKESSVASAMRASNVRVVDPAEVPPQPYKPRISINTALGLFFGMLAGLVFIVRRERSDLTIQQPNDSPFYLNLPELGVIPADLEGRPRFYYRNRSQDTKPEAMKPKVSGITLFPATSNGNVPPAPILDKERPELVTWQRKPSFAAESFRALLTSILFSGKNGQRPKVFVLTSASQGEGKTTVVSNLAIALAEIGQRVLVIDGDLRRPRMHDIFSVPNDRGLGDLLRTRTESIPLAIRTILPRGLGDLLRTRTESGDESGYFIRETSIPGLFVLPSGPPLSSAANLLYSPSLNELIKEFRSGFDSVIIDTPPMLHMPDARVVGRLADAVIIVIRACKTTRSAAMTARQRFAADNTHVMGTILNGWNPKEAPDDYYGEYKPSKDTHYES